MRVRQVKKFHDSHRNSSKIGKLIPNGKTILKNFSDIRIVSLYYFRN